MGDGEKNHLGRNLSPCDPQVKVDRMSDAPKDETGMNNETARIEVGSGHCWQSVWRHFKGQISCQKRGPIFERFKVDV